MLGGCAEDKRLSAVFCICSLLAGFVMDECLHSNGHKWVLVVVVLSVEVHICRHVGVDS